MDPYGIDLNLYVANRNGVYSAFKYWGGMNINLQKWGLQMGFTSALNYLLQHLYSVIFQCLFTMGFQLSPIMKFG